MIVAQTEIVLNETFENFTIATVAKESSFQVQKA